MKWGRRLASSLVGGRPWERGFVGRGRPWSAMWWTPWRGVFSSHRRQSPRNPDEGDPADDILSMIQFLGTSASHPTRMRNASSLYVRVGRPDLDGEARRSRIWIFDCGDGAARQLMASDAAVGKVERIFVTHLHGDHAFGLPSLICSLSAAWQDTSKLTHMHVYGPRGLAAMLRTMLGIPGAVLPFYLSIHELAPRSKTATEARKEAKYQPPPLAAERDSKGQVLSDVIYPDPSGIYEVCRDIRAVVRAAQITHTIPCFGYVIDEMPKRGHLNVEKLQGMGINDYRMYRLLKEGKAVPLPGKEGQFLDGSAFVDPPIRGRRIVILGDTCDASRIIPIGMDCDLLIHEATYSDEESSYAFDTGHSTSTMAGNTAKAMRAKRLILNHISSRFTRDELRTKLLPQAQLATEIEVIIAEDFLKVSVPLPDIRISHEEYQNITGGCDPKDSTKARGIHKGRKRARLPAGHGEEYWDQVGIDTKAVVSV